MLYKLKMTATIPVTQYGNLSPTIELEGDDYGKLQEEAMARIKELWTTYGERPLVEKGDSVNGFEERITFTGEKVLYNPLTHKYTDLDGKLLKSGSYYATQFAKKFNKSAVLPAFAKKNNVDEETVSNMWLDNGELSRVFGNAIHKLMENWYRYGKLSCYKEPKHPFLKQALDDFPDDIKNSKVLPEVMVSNVKEGYVGQIDGIVITGEKKCYLIDYKTDADVEPNLVKHFNQMSFYAHILISFGWEVSKVVVWNYIDKWEKYESEVLPLIKN